MEPTSSPDLKQVNVTEREQRVTALRAKLLDGVGLEPRNRNADQQARWLLAYLLDWHRREDKSAWWEFHRLMDLAPEQLAVIEGRHLVEAFRRQRLALFDDFPGAFGERSAMADQRARSEGADTDELGRIHIVVAQVDPGDVPIAATQVDVAHPQAPLAIQRAGDRVGRRHDCPRPRQ